MAESQHTEWKASWRDEYLKWICAFANTQGGQLDIGKNDKGKVVGIGGRAQDLLEILPNKIRGQLGVVAGVEILREQDKEFIRITVDPYFNPISYHGKYYIRSGSTTSQLTGAALDKFLLDKRGQHWDGQTTPRVSASDLNPITIAEFRSRAAKNRRLRIEYLDEPDNELINKLHLTAGGALKHAAILLFHSDPEQWFTGAFIKIGYFQDDATLLYQDEVHGNLFEQADKAMDLLLTKYNSAKIAYEGIQRTESYPVPEEALREILLNAIAHKDYASGNPIQINVYQDKILFWNNGQLPGNWTVRELKSKHASQPFNPDIASVLYLSGLIEAWGRGIERVVTACKKYSGTRVEFVYKSPGLWVRFIFQRLSSGGQSGASRGPVGGQSDRDIGILKALSETARSTAEIAEIIGLEKRSGSLRRSLKGLINNGHLKLTIPENPSSRMQKYSITGKGKKFLLSKTDGKLEGQSGASRGPVGGQSGASRGPVGGQSDRDIGILNALSETARSTAEIAEIIGLEKRSGSLRRSLKKLLADGYLELTIPETPGSRMQKYRITGKGRKFISSA